MPLENNRFVSVNLVVHNGEKYIRRCLDSVKKQIYGDFEVNILDNNSSDSTKEIIKKEFPEFNLIEGKKNLGTWPGQEELLKYSHGKYIAALSVDIILNENFITEAVKVFEKDEKIGAVQGKIYKYELSQLQTTNYKLQTNVVDTCGFQIFRSRRIVNIGHGLSACIVLQLQNDAGRRDKRNREFDFDREQEIFGVEGAVPVFRKQALEDCRLKSQSSSIVRLAKSDNTGNENKEGSGRIIDLDFFWYGDDLDLAWRMRLFGWKQVFAPKVIAHHDRQTTKALAGGSWREFIKIRKTVPMFKRQLDWRNTTLTIIKNDFTANFLRDLPFIFWRQLRLWVYFLLFETSMILEIFRVAKLLPKMLKRRDEIMRRTRVSAQEMRNWFV